MQATIRIRCNALLVGKAMAILLMALPPGRTQAAPVAPDEQVRQVFADVLAAVKGIPPGNREARDKALATVKQKILPHIDFERMTRLAVGRAWRTADARQRAELVSQFGTLITRTYSVAINAYDGHETQVDPLQLSQADDDVIVRSRFTKAGEQPIEVNYAMWKAPDGWKVYDITVANVSLVITYRTQFAEEVQRGGVDGLIRSLTEKNRATSLPSTR